VFIMEVEAEDLDLAIIALGECHGGGAIERELAHHRPGVIRDPAHDIEPARRAAQADRAIAEVGAQLAAHAAQQRRNGFRIQE
jgi:hypothetical protein